MNSATYATEFGRWTVKTWQPPPDLAPYVEIFWETIGTVNYGYEKIVPSGNAELMINLGPPQLLLRDSGGRARSRLNGGWLSGVQTMPLFNAPAVTCRQFPTHFVGARLLPTSIKPVFGIDAVDTVDHVIELEDLIGPASHRLIHDIDECSDTPGRFIRLVEFLRKALQKESLINHHMTRFAVQKTIEAKGNLRIEDICTELGISRKHLTSLYRETVGVTPKMFARLSRFRNVMDQLDCGNNSWVKMATDTGFFDQSHLIGDFNRFAGESPTSFLKNRAPDGESVNYSDYPDT